MAGKDEAAEERRLAEAAVEANDRGDTDEAQALLARARALDHDAVNEVLAGQKTGASENGQHKNGQEKDRA
jgi:hypothetical protein